MKQIVSAMLATAFVSSPAVAGPYDAPYSIIQAQQRSLVHDTQPATIMRVDEERMNPRRSDPVKPGIHVVEVSVPGPKGMAMPGRQVLVIDAQPCTRYYIAARRPTHTSRHWEAYVDQSEAIGECTLRFAM